MTASSPLPFEPLTVIEAPPAHSSIRRLFGPFFMTDRSATVRCAHRRFRLIPFWPIAIASLFHNHYFFKFVIPNLPRSMGNVISIVYVVSYLLSAGNLFATYLTNPGVLPWNWSVSRKKSYTSAELRDGVATTVDQFDWAQNHESPARSHFSKKVGFFILRADHDCFWVNGWIGIGNHRYFVNAVIITTFFCVFSGFWMIWNFFYGSYGNFLYLAVLLGLTGLCGVACVGQAVLQVVNLTRNRTAVEQLKGVWIGRTNPYRKDCLSNWEEVCGTRVCCPLWCCPCPLPRVEDGFGYQRFAENEEGRSFICRHHR
jgi:hypothetical protein